MEENLFDTVMDELHEVRGLVQEELKRQYGKANPFRMQAVDEKKVMSIYERMTPQDMDYAIQTYGQEAVNQFIYDMERKKTRR